jgi:hypothetical protein
LPVASAGGKCSISSAGERYGGLSIAIPIAFFQIQRQQAWNVPRADAPFSKHI